MPKTSKGRETGRRRVIKPREPEKVIDEQKDRSYYYDDACGYEVYVPDEEHDEDVADEDHST